MWLLSANKEQTKPFIMMLNLLHLDVFYSVCAIFVFWFFFLRNADYLFKKNIVLLLLPKQCAKEDVINHTDFIIFT